MPLEIHTAPSGTGELVLGRTVPSLLDEACERHPNPRAFNDPAGDGWRSLSNAAFRTFADELAAGLEALGIRPGERACLYLNSDVNFILADMGSALAGVVNVPIFLHGSDETVAYILEDSGATALFVRDRALLARARSWITDRTPLRLIVLAEGDGHDADPIPGVEITDLEGLRNAGRDRLAADSDLPARLRARLGAQDLATIIYTSGTTGRPKGVMLTHENLTSNALAGITGLPTLGRGADEITLSFLPLPHVFQRGIHYACMWAGHSIHFCEPDELGDRMRTVRPTFFAAVPRVLERVYERITTIGAALPAPRRQIFFWALGRAKRYRTGRPPRGLGAILHGIADRLVYSRWREATGGRVNCIISGGAALEAWLNDLFSAAGIMALQGYGMTETSPVITFNRPALNRPGTVGLPIAGVEVALADDGEVITRGPHVMRGYYERPEATAEVIDAEGWFHTGDIGSFDVDGYLRITDRKKNLFKLSTGKYVTPQPLESRLGTEPLVEHAVVVGEGHKYCAALIFPNQDALRAWTRRHGRDGDRPIEDIVTDPVVVSRFQHMIDKANEGMPDWTTVKRFTLVPRQLTIGDDLLTPTMKVRRGRLRELYGDLIEAMYAREEPHAESKGGLP